MPLWHNACVLNILEVGGGAVVVSVVGMEAPPIVLPQGTIPFTMVGLLVAILKAIGEGGVLVLSMALVCRYGTQLKAVFTFDVTPLVFRWPFFFFFFFFFFWNSSLLSGI